MPRSPHRGPRGSHVDWNIAVLESSEKSPRCKRKVTRDVDRAERPNPADDGSRVGRARSERINLPDLDALLGSKPELVTLLDAKSGVELRKVAEHSIAPKLGRRVRVGRQPSRELGVAVLHPPDPPPADKETLVTSQPVDHRSVVTLQRPVVRLVRDRHAPQVSDVLTNRESAVDLLAGKLSRLEPGVLIDEHLCPGL